MIKAGIILPEERDSAIKVSKKTASKIKSDEEKAKHMYKIAESRRRYREENKEEYREYMRNYMREYNKRLNCNNEVPS